MRVRKYYVEFAGRTGKSIFVGGGPKGYTSQRAAARLFTTIEAAQDAADDIDEVRYLAQGALPIINGRIVYEVDPPTSNGPVLPGLYVHERLHNA